MRVVSLALSLLLFTACGDSSSSVPDISICVGCLDQGIADQGTDSSAVDGSGSDTSSDIPAVACALGTQQVVQFTTEDSVTLEADLHLTTTDGAGAVVLLHMVPPSNDRTNYPQSFIDLLTQAGLNVLNVDRRGAGGSGGVAQEAYQGPNGVRDAKAAYLYLANHPSCNIDMSHVIWVGASNGTTTVFDFAVAAAADQALQAPKGLVWLTPGTYTENQHMVSANRTVLDALPILFNYPANEATWSDPFEPGKAAGWVFDKVNGGGHGTLMFSAQPSTQQSVANFITGL